MTESLITNRCAMTRFNTLLPQEAMTRKGAGDSGFNYSLRGYIDFRDDILKVECNY